MTENAKRTCNDQRYEHSILVHGTSTVVRGLSPPVTLLRSTVGQVAGFWDAPVSAPLRTPRFQPSAPPPCLSFTNATPSPGPRMEVEIMTWHQEDGLVV